MYEFIFTQQIIFDDIFDDLSNSNQGSLINNGNTLEALTTITNNEINYHTPIVNEHNNKSRIPTITAPYNLRSSKKV